MALTLGDNFSYQGAKPLDARLKYDTLANMKAVGDATMYDGCTAYCKEADKTYQWKSTNTVDETLGKWREYPSGGSTGGGHTIEDAEGTDLTQRDTLQFGEGFLAEDDDTNEKTVISPNVMQSGDMDDVITPLPSAMPRTHEYSTTEQVVGKWIDGKTIYEKTVQVTPTSAGVQIATDVDTFINAPIITRKYESGSSLIITNCGVDGAHSIAFKLMDNILYAITVSPSKYSAGQANITIWYTKTTD